MVMKESLHDLKELHDAKDLTEESPQDLSKKKGTEEGGAVSFEAALQQLEELLQRLNAHTISLEEALQCYEEADRLIVYCSSRLDAAQQRVEKLIKNRQGELVLGEGGVAEREPLVFQDPSSLGMSSRGKSEE